MLYTQRPDRHWTQCTTTLPHAVHTKARQALNIMHNNLRTYCIHKGEKGTSESAQVLEKVKNVPSPCLNQDFNLWQLLSLDHQHSALTTVLGPLCCERVTSCLMRSQPGLRQTLCVQVWLFPRLWELGGKVQPIISWMRFLKWRSTHAHQLPCLGQDQSTMAQWIETSVDEHFLMSTL